MALSSQNQNEKEAASVMGQPLFLCCIFALKRNLVSVAVHRKHRDVVACAIAVI
jgi:hypothetical protein